MKPLKPFGPVPSARQLRWHERELYGFLHFTVNTFTDRELGYGDEEESVFAPTAFDADAIARTAAEGGMKGLILTCKHHDGFCLWPSRFTEHSVRGSPWRNGRGDAVREVSDACRAHGLSFGVYLSPWDRTRADYGAPSYVAYYRNQLRELLSGYGPIFEVWFDGANGGDGYYGGAREQRTIDRTTYYGWEETWGIVRELQPDACIFSDAGPDVRWVGNEEGRAGDPCWATYTLAGSFPGLADSAGLNAGDASGADWVPAECDVSIRPGWFYHAAEDGKVKSPSELMDLYFASVGRGASLLLNVPPDRRGLVHEIDAASLRGFRARRDALFGCDLARQARASASNVRGADERFAASRAVDGAADTYWATDDGERDAELVLELPRAVTFNVVRLREPIMLGQRVRSFAIDQWSGGQWRQCAAAASIGACRLLRCGDVSTSRVRLRIIEGAASVAISEMGLFRGE